MDLNFKKIHVGELIRLRIEETGVQMDRICAFLKLSEVEILAMLTAESIDSNLLLRLSKLLEYDFFRVYSQHLILYAPPSTGGLTSKKTKLPEFRKNIYTIEVIEFVLELLSSGKKTKTEIIEEYRIPKTTLYKWISKHKK
jgi:hypothetical protein